VDGGGRGGEHYAGRRTRGAVGGGVVGISYKHLGRDAQNLPKPKPTRRGRGGCVLSRRVCAASARPSPRLARRKNSDSRSSDSGDSQSEAFIHSPRLDDGVQASVAPVSTECGTLSVAFHAPLSPVLLWQLAARARHAGSLRRREQCRLKRRHGRSSPPARAITSSRGPRVTLTVGRPPLLDHQRMVSVSTLAVCRSSRVGLPIYHRYALARNECFFDGIGIMCVHTSCVRCPCTHSSA
jgi:hypothetical protein